MGPSRMVPRRALRKQSVGIEMRMFPQRKVHMARGMPSCSASGYTGCRKVASREGKARHRGRQLCRHACSWYNRDHMVVCNGHDALP